MGQGVPFDLASLTGPAKPGQSPTQGEPAVDLSELFRDTTAAIAPAEPTPAGAPVVAEDPHPTSSRIRRAYEGMKAWERRIDEQNPIGESFNRGIVRGSIGLGLSSAGQVLEAVTPSRPVTPIGRATSAIAQAMQRGGEAVERHFAAPGPTRLDDVGAPRTNADLTTRPATAAEKAEDFLAFAGNATGELFGTSITTMLGYLSGGFAGAAGSSYVLNTGDIRKELSDLGVNGAKREAVAFLAGVPVAALDAFGLDHWASFLKKKFATAIAEQATKRAAGSTIKEVLKAGAEGAGKSLIAETPTEVAQEAIQHAATRAAAGKPVTEGLRERAEDVFVSTAVGSGIMGAAGGGGGAAMSRFRTPGATQEAAKPTPEPEAIAAEEEAPTVEAVEKAIAERKAELAAMPETDPERGGVESSLKVLESQRRTLLGEPDPDAKTARKADQPIVERPKVQRELDEDLEVTESTAVEKPDLFAQVEREIQKAGGAIENDQRDLIREDIENARAEFQGDELQREIRNIVEFYAPKPKEKAPAPAPTTSAAPAKPDVTRTEPRPFPAEDAADEESARTREVTKRLAEGRPGAIDFAAQEMAPRVPKGAVLVPVPGPEGTTDANRQLAQAISSYADGLIVADVLTREQAAGAERLTAEQEAASIMRTRRIPKKATGPVFLVDAIETTGARMHGARVALERDDAQSLTFAKAPVPEGLKPVDAAETKAAIAKKIERAKNRYSHVGDVGKLLQELSYEQGRLDDEHAKIHFFSRDEGNYVAFGQSLASGRAQAQTKHTRRRLDEIEAQLREMGIAEEDIAAARMDPEAAIELEGKLTESAEVDTSFDLAEFEADDAFRASLERPVKQPQVSSDAARDRAERPAAAEEATRPADEPSAEVAVGGGTERAGEPASDAGGTPEQRPGDDEAREARDETPTAGEGGREPELERPRLHSAFGVAKPAPIIEEQPTPEVVAERTGTTLEHPDDVLDGKSEDELRAIEKRARTDIEKYKKQLSGKGLKNPKTRGVTMNRVSEAERRLERVQVELDRLEGIKDVAEQGENAKKLERWLANVPQTLSEAQDAAWLIEHYVKDGDGNEEALLAQIAKSPLWTPYAQMTLKEFTTHEKRLNTALQSPKGAEPYFKKYNLPNYYTVDGGNELLRQRPDWMKAGDEYESELNRIEMYEDFVAGIKKGNLLGQGWGLTAEEQLPRVEHQLGQARVRKMTAATEHEAGRVRYLKELDQATNEDLFASDAPALKAEAPIDDLNVRREAYKAKLRELTEWRAMTGSRRVEFRLEKELGTALKKYQDALLEAAKTDADITPFDSPKVKAARRFTADIGYTADIDAPTREKMRTEAIDESQRRVERAEYGAYGKKMAMVLGLPGSGKTSLVVHPMAQFLDAGVSDIDHDKALFPEFADGWGSESVYREAGQLVAAQVRAQLQAEGFNYITPGVGTDTPNYLKALDELKANGYEVHIVHVIVPTDVAQRRAVERFENGGHFVRPEYIEFVGRKDHDTYEAAKRHPAVVGYAQIDNSGERARVVEERNAGWLALAEGIERSADSGRDDASVAAATDEVAGGADDVREVRGRLAPQPAGERAGDVSGAEGKRGSREERAGDAGTGAEPVRVASGAAQEGESAADESSRPRFRVERPGATGERDRDAGSADAGRGDGGRDAGGLQRPGAFDLFALSDEAPTAETAEQPKPKKAEPPKLGLVVSGENYVLPPKTDPYAGTITEKVKANIAAVKLLKQIEADARPATVEEQAILAKYVGWGSAAQYLDKGHKLYESALGQEIRALLTPEEFAAAAASTPNAHFTTPEVAQAIHGMLVEMGIDKGAILEPSMGSGIFLATTPKDAHFKWTGVELDSITGRIAKLLYPKSDIHVAGFETLERPDGFFDAAVGNVPFGNYPVYDPRYEKEKLASIHDYFFVRTLDLVRPGGIVAFITSRFTMDKADEGARKAMLARGHFLGAVRLPRTAFKASANTEVVVDIIVLQRREPGPLTFTELDNAFQQSYHITVKTDRTDSGEDRVRINAFYGSHPGHMLGTPTTTRGQYADNEFTLLPVAGINPATEAAKYLDKIAQATEYTPRQASAPGTRQAEAEPILAPMESKEGAFVVTGDGSLRVKEKGVLVPASVPKTQLDRVKRLTALRDAARRVFQTQLTGESDATVDAAMREANRLYDSFVSAHGPINLEKRIEINRKDSQGNPIVQTRFPNLQAFFDDPDWAIVAALEDYDRETGKAKKADLLTKRVLAAPQRPDRVDTPAEALPVVLAERGRVDIRAVAQLAGVNEEDAVRALSGVIYENPASNEFETAAKYLSGNVRVKLAQAQEAAKRDKRFQANLDALQAAQPKDLKPSEISAKLGAPWIPTSDIADFLDEVLGESGAKVHYFGVDATWKVTPPSSASRGSFAAMNEYGTDRADAYEIVEDALNLRATEVTDPDPTDHKKRIKNPTATLAAQEKQQKLKDAFAAWVWKDAARGERLSRFYNDNFNNTRLYVADGAHLTLPGAASHVNGRPFALRPHQKNVIWRILETGDVLMAHVVGAGKTYSMVAAAMEEKRLGLVRKPLFAVPNHMLEQFSREFKQLYPTANLLIATKDDFSKDARQAFIAKAAANDWDAIIMTHRSFEAVPMSEAFQREYIERQIDELESAIREAKSEKAERSLIKEIEKAKKRREEKLKKLSGKKKKDQHLSFEEMGVDRLYVDEGHMYKNLEFITKMRGVSVPTSERAFDLYLKTVYLRGLNPERTLVMATGTPISNALAEMFTMTRYMAPDLLAARRIAAFDAWAATFGETVTGLEIAPDGSGARLKTRFSKYQNAGELIQMFRSYADVQSNDDLKLPRPELKGKKINMVSAEPTSQLKAYVQLLVKRALAVREKKVDPDEDNFLNITTDGRHAALDMRLVRWDAEDNPKSKLNKAIDRIFEIWQETQGLRGAQLVFSDLSAPGSDPSLKRGGVAGFNVYDEVRSKLLARGVPKSEIRFMHEATNDEKKHRLMQDVRSGRVRILLGSTEKMGAGMNVQDRLIALHHLDAPWRPSDIEQRNGRILRQGNRVYDAQEIPHVEINAYVTEGSFDAYIWQTLERKAEFIRQAMKGDITMRELEEIGTVEVDFATAKAIASGNPKVMEKAKLDIEIARLQRLEAAHRDELFENRRELASLPTKLAEERKLETEARESTAMVEDTSADKFSIVISGKTITDRTDAAQMLSAIVQKAWIETPKEVTQQYHRRVGTFAGFELAVFSSRNIHGSPEVMLGLRGPASEWQEFQPNDSPRSIAQTLEAMPARFEKMAERRKATADRTEKRLTLLREKGDAPFEHSAKLKDLQAQVAVIDKELQEAAEKAERAARGDAEQKGPDERADEDLGGEPLYAVGDPFTATFLLARRVWQGIAKDGDSAPLVASSIPDVEKRWREARGVQPEGIRAKAGAALEAISKLGRHFPEIDPARSPLEAAAHELLLEHERAGKWAQAVAYDRIAGITDGLTKEEADLMTRTLVLPDILKDIEAGLYSGGKSLPFGYENANQIRRDLAKYHHEIKMRHPKVNEAREKRRAFMRQLTRELVDADLLPAKVLDDDRYYHRQVMAYVNAADSRPYVGATKGKEVRPRLRGFQRQREGGGDFNTNYVESEFEYVAQALTELKTKANLEQLKELADRSADLKVMARRENMVRLGDKLARDAGLDPSMEGPFLVRQALSPFAQKIAIGTGKVLDAIADGDIKVDGFDDLTRDLGNAFVEWKEKDKDKRGPFNVGHPRWWSFLAALVKTEGPGAAGAAQIFKGIAQRDQFMRETLGSEFINPKPMSRDDWEHLAELAPEGYVTWQPEKGNHFFTVHSFDERAIATAMAGERQLTEADRKDMMAMGGAKETWIIPDWLAATLNHFGVQPAVEGPLGSLDRAWTKVIGVWKQHVLLFPTRFGRYNLNNMSGDVDAALAYSPAILKRVPAASRDLFYSMFKRSAPEGQKREGLDKQMERLVELGVIDQGLTALEIPDVNDLPAFERLANSDPKTFMQFLLSLGPKYYKHARALTQYRENILRLAAFRYFDERIQGGARDLYAASNPARVEAVKKDPKKYAALLARDLIGDYQAVSVWTQWMRNRGLPFFSFQEVNFKRYLRLFGNVAREEGGAGAGERAARLGGVVGMRVAKNLAVRAFQVNMFMFTIALWNALFFDDEDEELRRENRDQLHLILGRDDETNEIISMRIEGAFASLLGWLDLQDYIEDVHDVVKGDVALAEKAVDAAKAPINRIVQLWEPITKGVGELLARRKLYPDAFRPRPIRDRMEHAAGMLALDRIYNKVTGKPAPPGNWLAKLFVYRTDPGEAAYYDTRTRAAKWLEENGKERTLPGDPTDRANALYYWKRATQWGDEKAAAKWKAEYFRLGGSQKGMMQSIRLSEPLGAIALKDRNRFKKSLKPNELEIVEMAEAWFKRVYGNKGARLRLARPGTDSTAPAPAAERPRFRVGGT